MYVHELTEIEQVCGVTLDACADMMDKVLVRDNRVIFPAYTSAALASSVARCAFGGEAVEFAGLNSLAQPVYRRL